MYTCVTFGKILKTTEFNHYCTVSGYYVDGSGCWMSSKIEIHIIHKLLYVYYRMFFLTFISANY